MQKLDVSYSKDIVIYYKIVQIIRWKRKQYPVIFLPFIIEKAL